MLVVVREPGQVADEDEPEDVHKQRPDHHDQDDRVLVLGSCITYDKVAPGDVREEEDGQVVVGSGEAADGSEEGSEQEKLGDDGCDG